MLLPHTGHFSSSCTSGFFCVPPMGLVVLQSGYPVQAKKVPKRPFFSTMGRPQFSQYSSSPCSARSILSTSGRSTVSSRVYVQSGYPVQAMKLPWRPHLITRGLPHFSQIKSDGTAHRLDHQGPAALLADQVGGPFHPLDVGHVLFGVLQVFVELFVELPDGHAPGDLPRFDLVQFLLHAGGILDVENIVEVLEQQPGDHSAQLGGVETAALLPHVLALLNKIGRASCRERS